MNEPPTKETKPSALTEVYRFVLVGIGSNLINFTIYLLLVGMGLSVFLSSLSGYAIGLMFSFLLGKMWVFDAGSLPARSTAIRFGLVYLIGGLGMSLIADFCYEFTPLDYRVCWLLGAVFAVINNFLGSKYFAFRKQEYEE